MQLIRVLFCTAPIIFCVCKSTKTEVIINQCLTQYIKQFLSSRPLTLLHDSDSNSLIHNLFFNNIPITIRNLSIRQNFGHAAFSNRKFVNGHDFESIIEYDGDKIWTDYILLVKELKILYQIVHVLTNETSWNSQAKYLIVLETKENSEQVCTKMLQVLQDNFVYNVVCAILNSGGNSSSFYTWYPYTKEGGCNRKVKAKLLGSCTTWFEDPYKNKVPKNLNKCLVSFGWYALSGVKAVFNFNLIETFGELTNSSIEFHRNDEYIQEIFRSGTNFAIKKDVASKLIDIGPPLGLTLKEYLSFECVIHYGFDFSFYWILPQRRPISLLTKLLLMDHLGLIVTLVLVSFLVLIATWWVLVYFDMSADLSLAFTLVISICLSFSPPFAPASRKTRMLLMFCFGAFIPLDVAVQSLLTSTLTEPYLEPKVDNICDLAKSDLIMYYQHGLFTHLLGGMDNKTQEMVSRKSVPLTSNEVEQIKRISGTTRMAVLIPRTKLWHLRNYEEAEVFKQRATITIAHWGVPKGHLLTDHLKDMFLKSFEAALHVRWYLEWSSLENKVDYRKTAYVVSPMKFQDIKMALFVLFLGLSLATIAFVAEILCKMFWKQ